jgi:hypothetical protein
LPEGNILDDACLKKETLCLCLSKFNGDKIWRLTLMLIRYGLFCLII